MTEHLRKQSAKPTWRESPHLSFATQSLKIPGDPETPSDFNRALNYLETITTHFLECGDLENREAWEVSYELSYHNAWHQWEVEQERKSGERTAEYREIKLHHLRAMSKRRVLAMIEMGQQDDTSLSVAQHFDLLIEQAIAEEEALDRLRTPAPDELPL